MPATRPLPTLSITVGVRQPIAKLGSLQWSATSGLGDEALSFDLTNKEYAAGKATGDYVYGSKVTLKESSGVVLWYGFLDTPAPGDDRVTLKANGYGSLLDTALPSGQTVNAIFAQDMDLSGWSDIAESPFNVPNPSPPLSAAITADGYMRWSDNGAGAGSGDDGGIAGLAKTYPGLSIGRFAYRTGKLAPGGIGQSPDYYFQYWVLASALGGAALKWRDDDGTYIAKQVGFAIRPGSFTDVSFVNTALTVQSGDGAARYVPVGTPYDTFAIVMGGGSQGATHTRANIINIRMNGTLVLGDTWTASDALKYLGGQMGWDTTGVEASGVNILPFYLEDGGDRATLADYSAALEAGTWGLRGVIGGKPAMYANPWPTSSTGAHVWKLTRADPTNPPQGFGSPVSSPDYFNVVKLNYSDWTGNGWTVVKSAAVGSQADTDIRVKLGVNKIKHESLGGSFPPPGFVLPCSSPPCTQVPVSALTPGNVCQALLTAFSRVDFAGPITTAWVYDLAGNKVPAWRVRPGDAIYVTEDQQLYLVKSLTGGEAGCQITVGGVRASLDQILAQASRDAVRGADRFAF